MDFVATKAIETKVKRLGHDIGLNGVLGIGSSSNENNNFSIFSPDGTDEEGAIETRSDGQGDIFSVPLATYFDGQPNNFPAVIHLFYVDRTILSEYAASSVQWALNSFLFLIVLLLFNFVSGLLFLILERQTEWVFVLLAGVIALFVTLFELFAYETAFRGAYRTSTQIRRRYLIFCAVNMVIACIYAFVGGAWFNGWSRIGELIGSKDGRHRKLRVAFTAVEAAGWTVYLFVSTFTLFEYYHLWSGERQGLNDNALRRANAGIYGEDAQSRRSNPRTGDSTPARGQVGNAERTRGERIQQIRNKYRPAQSTI